MKKLRYTIQKVQKSSWNKLYFSSSAYYYYYFYDPGTQFPGNEKNTLCNTKSAKIKLE